MITTPSSNSSFAAGVGLWALGWATLFKLNKVPVLRRFVNRERILDWVNDNKVVALLMTEGINFGVHGISNPNSVTMALGGTLWNSFMLFIALPFRQWRRKQAGVRDILQGI